MNEIGIHSASSTGDLESLVSLLRFNKKLVNDVNQFGMTPLHGAAFHGQLEAARILLDYGANPNHPSAGEKYTFPLHLAVSRLNKPLIELLLVEGGADPATKDYLGQTILDVAQSISVETDSVAKDPETNIQIMNYIKECIVVKAAQTSTRQANKTFIYKSQHDDNVNKSGIKSIISENLSDADDFDHLGIDPEIRESQLMCHFFTSGIL